MAEATQYKFTLKEVAEALVKKQDIHEGLWQLGFEFGLAAAHTGPSKDEIYPTAFVPVMKAGLQEVKEETSLSVDAAKVNPLPEPLKTEAKKSSRKTTQPAE